MSSFDNGPSATSSFDDAPSRRFESAAPEFRSFASNPSNPYDLTTGLGRHLMDGSPVSGSNLPVPEQELSWKQFGSMVALGLFGAMALSLIF